MITFSYSRISSFMSCPYKHWLRYVKCIKPKKIVRPLTFGGDFHKLLQVRSDPNQVKAILEEIKDNFYHLPPDQQSELGENYLEDIQTIFSDYNQVWGADELPEKTEEEFNIELFRYKKELVLFNGVIDELYSDGTIGEHKTFTYAPDISELVMNQQVCLYAKARQLMSGKLPNQVLWDYIRSRPADKPVWLAKSKRFSAAQSSKITPQSWLRACEELGIVDPHILNQAERYRQNIPNNFFRHRLDIVPPMVDAVWEGFVYMVKDILKRGDKNKIKCVNSQCKFCDFRPICNAEFSGADVDYIIEKDFVERR